MQNRGSIRERYLTRFSIILDNTRQRKTLLAIPEVCADKFITLYHISLFVIKHI